MQDLPYRQILTAETMLALLGKTRAFTEAELPLRIGNNTDGTLIPTGVLATFLNGLPKNYPVALLTRWPHSKGLQDILAKTGASFILCRTVTPPHKTLDYYSDPDKALGAFLEARCQKVLNLGPICQENLGQTSDLVTSGKIPEGTRVIFAPLNLRLLPGAVSRRVSACPITDEQIGQLERLALKNGHIVHRANNCAIAEVTGRPSFEFADINTSVAWRLNSATSGTSNNRDLKSTCPACSNLSTCQGYFENQDIPSDMVMRLAQSLGLPEVRIQHQQPGLIVLAGDGITKAETSYFSGRLRCRVTAINSLVLLDNWAAERWMESGFYPVEEIMQLADHFDPLLTAPPGSYDI